MKNLSAYKHTNNTEANTVSNPEKGGIDSAIDLEFISNLISKAILSSEKIKGKSSFFILGRSGAGKSTTVNYLLGAKMEREIKKESEKINKGEFYSSESESEDDTTLEKNKIDYHAPIKVVGKEFAKIGHTTKSETIFPSIIPKEANTDFLFCDCPGFLDNRDPAYRVAISFGTELSVKASKKIRGLLICIPYDDLMDTRAQNLRVVVEILANLFKRTPSVDSMVFFITRVGDKKQKEVIKKVRRAIKKLGKEYNSDLKKIDDTNHLTIKQVKEAKQLSNLLSFLRLLLVKDKLVVVDILHEGIGMTREAVLKKIEELSPIKKENFKFNTFDSKRKEFLDQLNSYAMNKSDLFRNLEHNLEKARSLLKQIRWLKHKIKEELKSITEKIERSVDREKDILQKTLELRLNSSQEIRLINAKYEEVISCLHIVNAHDNNHNKNLDIYSINKKLQKRVQCLDNERTNLRRIILKFDDEIKDTRCELKLLKQKKETLSEWKAVEEKKIIDYKEKLKSEMKNLAKAVFITKILENINVRDYSKFSNITDVIYNLISHELVDGELYSSIVSFYNKFSTQKKEINYLYKKGKINDLQFAFNKIKKALPNKNIKSF